ncbi:hypothetical protein SFRURICE_005245 [Spodoptera frugiperda]|nr:hypothetical protein SFRURICE_005245 [Spodoptera frugiperda]
MHNSLSKASTGDERALLVMFPSFVRKEKVTNWRKLKYRQRGPLCGATIMYFFSPLRHITERDLIYSGTGPGDGSLRRESIQIAVPILATLEVDSIGHQHT